MIMYFPYFQEDTCLGYGRLNSKPYVLGMGHSPGILRVADGMYITS